MSGPKHRLWSSNFNPRSREGSDDTDGERVFLHLDFNPRSREGSDQCYGIVKLIIPYFNPRSREGSDPMPCSSTTWNTIFQSTLP